MSEDVGILITQFVSAEPEYPSFSRFSGAIANLINNDSLSLLQFIQLLGPRITSTDDEERARSVHCLTESLHELHSINPKKLARQDVNVMMEFYLSKFDDLQCFKYIIQGCYYLINFTGFSPNANDNLSKLLSNVLHHYDSSKLLAKVRYEGFRLLESVFQFEKSLISSKELADLYTRTFIHVSTGEKDPRNLLISFKVNKLINKNFSFDITNETEKSQINEMFDNCFCYFPISFTPPANDPYKITAGELKGSLRDALTGQDLFANDLYSNLFEKLTSTNPVIRNDVLLTILASIESFSVDTVTQYWQKLWGNLKYEILHLDNLSMFQSNEDTFIPSDLLELSDNEDKKCVYLALEILNQLVQKLDFSEFCLETITTDLKDHLSVSNKYFKQGVILLGSIASKSEYGFNYIMKYIFKPENLGKFISADGDKELESDALDSSDEIAMTVNKQRDLIDNFGYIFISYQVLTKTIPKEALFYTNNHLSKVKDHIIIFFGQLLQLSSNIEKTLKGKIIRQYIKVIELQNFLSFEERKLIIGIITDMFNDIVSEPEFQLSDLIVSEILDGLSKLLSYNNEEINRCVIEIFLPTVLNRIQPDEPNLYKYLDILNRLIINYQLLEIISIRLINRLLMVNQEQQKFSFQLLELILKLVYKIESSQQFLMNSWYKNFLPHLFRLIDQSFQNGGSKDILEIISDLVGVIVKYNDKSKHQDMADKFFKVFVEQELAPELNLVGVELTKSPGYMIVVYNKILANLDKSTKLAVDEMYIETLTSQISSLNDEVLKIAYLQHLSLVVNKFYDNNQYFETKLTQLSSKLSTPTEMVNFEISIWIIKSLVLKLNPVGMNHLNQLLEELELHPKVSLQAFNIVLRDLKIYSPNKEIPKGTKIISKVNHLNVRLLYKQQLLNAILDKVLLNGESIIYLSLLSILTKNTDPNILKFRINEIIPLIVQSLKVNTLLDTSLDTLQIIIENNDLMDFMPFLVSRLVTLASGKIVQEGKLVNTEKIRYLALKCLMGLLEKHEKPVVMLYKPEILAGLGKSVDDPKRLVRKLACDIRQMLFEMRE